VWSGGLGKCDDQLALVVAKVATARHPLVATVRYSSTAVERFGTQYDSRDREPCMVLTGGASVWSAGLGKCDDQLALVVAKVLLLERFATQHGSHDHDHDRGHGFEAFSGEIFGLGKCDDQLALVVAKVATARYPSGRDRALLLHRCRAIWDTV
jgi:hypothetical protein